MRLAREPGDPSKARAAEANDQFAKCKSDACRLAICRAIPAKGLIRGLFCGQLEGKLGFGAGTTYAMAP